MFPVKGNRLASLVRCLNRQTKRLSQGVSATVTNQDSSTSNIKEVTNGIEVTVPSNEQTKRLTLDYMWLFNHCRCSKCFSWKTLQKFGDPRFFVEDVKPLQVKIDERKLHLTWSNDHHSTFNFDFLEKYANNDKCEQKAETKRNLWNGTLQRKDFPEVIYNKSEDDDSFARKVLQHVTNTGFCLINGVAATLNDSKEAMLKIGPLQKSYLGEMWDLVAVDDFPDTAYTNEGLPPHVDATYLTDPFGLIMLHCIQESATGGDSFLIDGFHVAEQLKREHPQHFEYLSTTPIESMYIDKQGLYYKHSEPIIKLDPITKDLEQIRFNFTDISPISNISQFEVRKFYKAYGTLAKGIYDASNRINFRLKPGTMLLFDNWRLVHGRTPYTGNRLLCGCFIGRSDFLSRSRVLGLLTKDFAVDFTKGH